MSKKRAGGMVSFLNKGIFLGIGSIILSGCLSSIDPNFKVVVSSEQVQVKNNQTTSTTGTTPSYVSPSSTTQAQVSTLFFNGLTSIDQVTYHSVRLNWDPVDGAIGYVVYQILNGTPLYLATVPVGATQITVFTVHGLSASITYSFRVRLLDQQGLSDANTNDLSTTTLAAPPAAFTGGSSTSSSIPVHHLITGSGPVPQIPDANSTNCPDPQALDPNDNCFENEVVIIEGSGVAESKGTHTFEKLEIQDHAILRVVYSSDVHQPNTLDITTKDLIVQEGASLRVDENGYMGARPNTGFNNDRSGLIQDPNNPQQATDKGASQSYCGGSYGGRGGCVFWQIPDSSLRVGLVAKPYGSFENPNGFGSGGGSYRYQTAYFGGNGGGKLQLHVTGAAQIDGMISANGSDANSVYKGTVKVRSVNYPGVYYRGSGGAGGSILLKVDGSFFGKGRIQARGGKGYPNVGYGGGYYYVGASGGGGRISVQVDPNATVGFTGTLNASGGTEGGDWWNKEYMVAEPGSVFFNHSALASKVTLAGGKFESGNATLKNYLKNRGSEWKINKTFIVEDGQVLDSVQKITVTGGYSQLDGDFPNLTEIAIEPGGYLVLQENFTIPPTVNVTVNGGVLVLNGDFTFDQFKVLLGGKVTQWNTRRNWVAQQDGTWAQTQKIYHTKIIANTIEVDPTAAIDVSEKGFPGWNEGGVYYAMPSIYYYHGDSLGSDNSQGSYYYAGGSHGGGGSSYYSNRFISDGGYIADVYDNEEAAGVPAATHSIKFPDLPGSGGAGHGWNQVGAAGGGALWIQAMQDFILNGKVLANGERTRSGTNITDYGGGGAGGSVLIEGAKLQGKGTISANGGIASNVTYGGRGGGGRVSILTLDNQFFTGSIGASRGTYGTTRARDAEDGTVYVEKPVPQAKLLAGALLGNALEGLSSSGVFSLDLGLGDLTVDASQTLLNPTSIEILSGGVVTLGGSFPNVTSVSVKGGNTVQLSGTYAGLQTLSISGGSRVELSGDFSGLQTLDISTGGENVFILETAVFPSTLKVLVRNKSTLAASGNFTWDDLKIKEISRVTSDETNKDNPKKLTLTVNTLFVEKSSSLDVDGKGFRGAHGDSTDGISYYYGWREDSVTGLGTQTGASFYGCGGSYGGHGGCSYVQMLDSVWKVEESRGDFKNPTFLGSGGGKTWNDTSRTGGHGGGFLKVVVLNQAQVDGKVSSNGIDLGAQTYTYKNSSGTLVALHHYGSGGSGGSLIFKAHKLLGSGMIEARGGTGYNYSYWRGDGGGKAGAAGGGGRLALIGIGTAPDFSGFSGLVNAGGGESGDDLSYPGYFPAEPGSVFIAKEDPANVGTFTALSFLKLTLQGAKFELNNNTLLDMISDRGLTTLTFDGSVHISQGMSIPNTVTSILVKKGHASVLDGSFPGVTSITVESGGTLFIGEHATFSSIPAPDLFVLGGKVFIAGTHAFKKIEVRMGGVISQPHTRINNQFFSFASPLVRTTLSADTIYIDSASRISADATGSPGANTGGNDFYYKGATFRPGATPSQYAAGGSNGGHGGENQSASVYNSSAGETPLVADSLTDPSFIGDGGSGYNNNNNHGGSGGGYLKLIVKNTLQNDGVISANGENVPWSSGPSDDGGGGAGGSLVIADDGGGASVLNGFGRIEARGGSGRGKGGRGGGGRIALALSSMSAFRGIVDAGVGASGYGNPEPGPIYVANPISSFAHLVGGSFTGTNASINNLIQGDLFLISDSLSIDSFVSVTGNATSPIQTIQVGGGSDVVLAGTFSEGNLLQVQGGGNVTLSGTFSKVKTLEISGGTKVTISGDFSQALTTLKITGGSEVRLDGMQVGTSFTSLQILNGPGTKVFISKTTLTNQSALDVLVDQGSTFEIDGAHTWKSLTVQGQSSVRVPDVTSASMLPILNLQLTNFTVLAGSRVYVDGQGYRGASNSWSGGYSGWWNDPGAGITQAGGSEYYCGGSYGGRGGCYWYHYHFGLMSQTPTFGDALNPILGGGGGGRYYADTSRSGGSGGGVLKINVSSTAQVDGVISTNGAGGYNASGGAGGSIHFTAGTLLGMGGFEAKGGSGVIPTNGDWNSRGSNGGGGRIYVKVSTDMTGFSGFFNALGGKYGYDMSFSSDWRESLTYLPAEPGTVVIDAPTTGSQYANFTLNGFQDVGFGTPKNSALLEHLKEKGTLALVTVRSDTIFDPLMTYTGVQVLRFEEGISTLQGNFPDLQKIEILGNSTYVKLNGSALTFPSTVDLFVTDFGKAEINSQDTSTPIVFQDVQVLSSGLLTHQGLRYRLSDGVKEFHPMVFSVRNLTVDNTSSIDLIEKGYPGSHMRGNFSSYGGHPLLNVDNTKLGTYYGGGSHGGLGQSNASVTYGDPNVPLTPGSGGNWTYYLGTDGSGSGGGALKLLVSNLLQLDGTITVKGGNAWRIDNTYWTGAGAGGSIYVIATGTTKIQGTGSFNAEGGDAIVGSYKNDSAGGGGRMAVRVQSGASLDMSGFSGTLSVLGGMGYSRAGNGTLCVEAGVPYPNATVTGEQPASTCQ